jgi:hypothetical protein
MVKTIQTMTERGLPRLVDLTKGENPHIVTCKINFMKDLTITPPEGYEIDEANSSFSKIVFKPIKKSKRKWRDYPKVVEGYYISSDSGIHSYFYSITSGWPANRNTWPTKELAEASLALSQLLQWMKLDEFNGDWVPDFTNNRTSKYIIHFLHSNIATGEALNKNEILAFKTVDARDRFLGEFKELIEIAKPLL